VWQDHDFAMQSAVYPNLGHCNAATKRFRLGSDISTDAPDAVMWMPSVPAANNRFEVPDPDAERDRRTRDEKIAAAKELEDAGLDHEHTYGWESDYNVVNWKPEEQAGGGDPGRHQERAQRSPRRTNCRGWAWRSVVDQGAANASEGLGRAAGMSAGSEEGQAHDERVHGCQD